MKAMIAKVFRVALRRIVGLFPGGRRFCVACGHRVLRFFPYRGGRVPPLMRALETVGSDVVNFACPRCGAHDRERHLLLYLQAANLLEGMHGKSILHFAPERQLLKHIRSMRPHRLILCDLFPASKDVVKADITRLPFESESFDALIANHVLEHVADDTKALAEIGRILKPGGFAILQVPYSRKLTRTWEDPGINDETARLLAFGQEDHVRLYGKDVFDRFASLSGLLADVRTHAGLLAGIDARRFGVNPDEPLFLFRK